MAEIREDEDFGQVGIGTLLRVKQERTIPTGPLFGTLIANPPEELDSMWDQFESALSQRGIVVARRVEFDRAEWTGVFTYEVELIMEITDLRPAQGQTPQELQAAVWGVFVGVVIVVVAVAICFVSDDVREVAKDLRSTIDRDFPVVAVALGFLAIALLAREIRKTKALGHGTL